MCARKTSLFAVVFVLLAGIPAKAQWVRYVDDDALPGGNGKTWNTAYKYLQDALTAAAGATGTKEIRIARGSYKPDQGAGQLAGNRSASFELWNGVTLRGGYAGPGAPDPDGRDIFANETTLSGDLVGNDGPFAVNMGDNSYHVLRRQGSGANAALDGLTIRGGNANATEYPNNGGGAIWNYGTQLTLTDCTFRNNFAGSGGALITWNAVTMLRCLFVANQAEYGAAIWNVTSAPLSAVNCRFVDNVATVSGGVTFNAAGAPRYLNCIFENNRARYGGILLNHSGIPSFINCTFVGNTAIENAGILWIYNADSVVFQNCIIWANNTPPNGVLIEIASNGTAHISHTLLEGGQASLRLGTGVNLTWGPSNLDTDPLFFGSAEGRDDFELQIGSPCIDAGDNMIVPADLADLNGNGNTTERTPIDMKGIARFLDDPQTLDTGNPDLPAYPAVVDLGAYEYDPDHDSDRDGVADIFDNCRFTPNSDQADTDRDTLGNACDNCPGVSNLPQVDTDGDGLGDECDNCPATSNTDQSDLDRDGRGDLCDVDIDGDGKPNAQDSCPFLYSFDESDRDQDGVGDLCDACVNTPTGFPVRPNGCPDVQSDFDADGDVDQTDFGHLQLCLGQRFLEIQPACEKANLNGDAFVNAHDFTLFADCMGGANSPPLLSCID